MKKAPTHDQASGASVPSQAPRQADTRESSRTDSRTLVIQRQRASEKDTAPDHDLLPEQRRKLWEIAARPIGDEDKLIAALRDAGPLTACDMSADLRLSAPHARLHGLRHAGLIRDLGWVRQRWGRVRTLKLYGLGGE